ncbi:MAG: LicD family protein [Clostridia bacterium]|nr:LicD family protein [Clostridia bacterium]
MELEKEFYLEEERCGFTVSAQMKAVWAVQLDLLEQLGQVCQKHGLRYFASGGTLLGAVRHKGYIPWDDDIDIQMPREDYERLLQVAPTEFAEPYFFQTAYNDVQFSRGHAQLRNSNTTAIMLTEKGKYSFNQGIFIDIFPLDGVGDTASALAKQRKRVQFWNRLLSLTVRYPANTNKSFAKGLLHGILRWLPYRPLYRRMEKACRQYEGASTERVALISFDAYNDKLVFPRRCLEETVWLPFESTTIPAPAGYDEMLTIQYGDYMTMRQENTYHGGLLFDTERCYVDYIRNSPSKTV